MAWFFYLVRCNDDSLYAGITTDVERRVAQHNDGTGARYTRSRGPVRLEHSEPWPDRAAASRREREVKRWDRQDKEALIAGGAAKGVAR